MRRMGRTRRPYKAHPASGFAPPASGKAEPRSLASSRLPATARTPGAATSRATVGRHPHERRARRSHGALAGACGRQERRTRQAVICSSASQHSYLRSVHSNSSGFRFYEGFKPPAKLFSSRVTVAVFSGLNTITTVLSNRYSHL